MNDNDLKGTIQALLVAAILISATWAWLAFAQRPTRGGLRRAVRRTLPLI